MIQLSQAAVDPKAVFECVTLEDKRFPFAVNGVLVKSWDDPQDEGIEDFCE